MPLHDGAIIKMLTVQSANSQIAMAARKEGAEVVIIQNPLTGNTQIFSRRENRFELADVAHLLNIAEQVYQRQTDDRGRLQVMKPWILRSEGVIPGGRWYYHPTMRAVMNGSLTAEMPKTGQPLPLIARLTHVGIYF